MDIALFAEEAKLRAKSIATGVVVFLDYTNLQEALTGDDGAALYVVVGKLNDQVELFGVADGQLRTCNPNRYLNVVSCDWRHERSHDTDTRVKLSTLKPGATFRIADEDMNGDNHYVLSGAKPSVPNNLRVYQIGSWIQEHLDTDRLVTPTKFVCGVKTN